MSDGRRDFDFWLGDWRVDLDHALHAAVVTLESSVRAGLSQESLPERSPVCIAIQAHADRPKGLYNSPMGSHVAIKEISMGSIWNWATLNDTQQTALLEAERTLGVEYLLAFRAEEGSAAQGALARAITRGLPLAALDESQLECLRVLERQLETVVIAYGKQGA